LFKAEYIVGQQLLGFTLRVNPWLWNWAQKRVYPMHYF